MTPLKPLFKLTSLIALSGWLMLVCLPFWSYTDELVLGLSVVLLAIVYSWLLFVAMRQRPEPGSGRPGFFSLGGVLSLLRQPTAALDSYPRVRSDGRVVYTP